MPKPLSWPDENGLILTCMVWHPSENVLRPIAGAFPPETWGSALPHGAGVAGYAFRLGRAMTWTDDWEGTARDDERQGTDRLTSLLLKRLPTKGHRLYKWIICIPLLDGPAGIACGVVNIAGLDAATETSRYLRDLAREAASRTGTRSKADEPPPEPGAAIVSLERTFNQAFWSDLKDAAPGTKYAVRLAQRACRAWEQPATK